MVLWDGYAATGFKQLFAQLLVSISEPERRLAAGRALRTAWPSGPEPPEPQPQPRAPSHNSDQVRGRSRQLVLSHIASKKFINHINPALHAGHGHSRFFLQDSFVETKP